MLNVSESRKTRAHTSDTDLAQMMVDPERVMRNPVNPSFFTTFRRKEENVLEQIDNLEGALR